MSNYVYILLCNDNTFYAGYTNNLEKRLKHHNLGKASKYTRGRLPVEYIFQHKCDSKSHALKLEYRIKTLTRIKKIKLIEDQALNDYYGNKGFKKTYHKLKEIKSKQ